MASETKAWMCWAPEIVDGTPDNGDVGIYRAATRSKARYLCVLDARDAGFEIGFPDVKVRRAPEFDRATFRDGMVPRYIEIEGEDDG